MKSKHIKCSFVLVAVLSLLTGCQPEVYSFQTINGQHYLVFEDAEKYEPDNQGDASAMVLAPEIKFSSMDEFVDRVTNQKLDERELMTLARFARDEKGIKVCDFSNLCRPDLPQDLPSSNFIWEGEIYAVSFGNSQNGEQFGNFICMPEERYNAKFKYEYEDFFSRDKVTVTKRETVDDRNAEVTYYTTGAGKFKRIRHSFLHEGSEYIVDEVYRLHMYNSSLVVSDTVPDRIMIYIKNDKHYGWVQLFDLPVRPEESWLKQFRLTPYAAE